MGGEDGDEEWLKDIADDLCYEDPEEEQGGRGGTRNRSACNERISCPKWKRG